MLLLIFIPAFALASFLHAVLQAWAPSNILIRRVKDAPPRWSTAGCLLLLAYALASVVHVGDIALSAGAPAWLAFPVGILAWDAIKIATLGVASAVRRLGATEVATVGRTCVRRRAVHAARRATSNVGS